MANTYTGSAISAKTIHESTARWEHGESASISNVQKDTILELSSIASSFEPLDQDGIPDVTQSDQDPIATRKQESGDSKVLSDPISNTQQFYSWFHEIQTQMDEDEEFDLRQYITLLEHFREQCFLLMNNVQTSIEELAQLEGQHKFVSTKTNALHQSCEHLLEEQTSLMSAAEAIKSKLSYFNELDRINTKLNAQSLSVSSEGFVPLLNRIDECLTFITTHGSIKDSAVYAARFHQCLTKALSLVRNRVISLLTTATQNMQSNSNKTASVGDDAFTLYYGKFRQSAPLIKSLLEQIERKAANNSLYVQLLTDCYQCYISQREILVEPSIVAAVRELYSKHKTDHCALMRSGCALMLHICEDEYQLYNHFFNTHSPLLDDFLERLCNYLYDTFRPLIIHILHMETLAELCSILKIEMLEEHVSGEEVKLRAFEKICLQMLQDVQERLVYRTYIYINSDILNYKPAPGDLAYPDKLIMMKSIAESLSAEQQKPAISMNSSTQSLDSQEVESILSPERPADSLANQNGFPAPHGRSTSSTSPADLHGMWYPTVRKTLLCLSKLSRCTDSETFQGLSQEALSFCIKSLLLARQKISSNKSYADAQLFYIKHLLIVREQITPFHASFAVRETKLAFHHIKDAAYGLVKHGSNLFKFNSTNAFLHFLYDGTPQALEEVMDSKLEVDLQIKLSCSEFIDHVTKQLIGGLTDFITKAQVIIARSNSGTVTLASQPFAKPEAVREVVAESYRNMKTKTPTIQNNMSLYLSNKETESILFKPVKTQVLKTVQSMLEILEQQYSEEERQIIACPSIEQVQLVLPSK